MNDDEIALYFRDRRVFVTGGAGMIGSHVVEMLVDMGAKVTVPVRPSTSLENLHNVESRVGIVQADLFDRSQVDRAIAGSEIVLHLGAAKGGGIAHSMLHHGSLFRDNLLGFIHVLDAARDARVRRTLVVSSACVYPRQSTIPIPEEEGVKDAPEATNAGYGWSKRMVEYMTLAYRDEYGMNVGIARPFNAYGPRDDFFREYSHVIPDLIRRFARGDLEVWGSGRQTRAFVYVTDVARGVLRAAAHENVTGPVNIGTDEEVSISALAGMIRELLGIDREIVHDVSKPDGQPRRACDTRLARQAIGYEARVPIRDGLRLSIEWYLGEQRKRLTA